MFTTILEPSHLLIVLIAALVFLGPKRLPHAGRALGQGLREFKGAIGGSEDELALRRTTDTHTTTEGRL